MIAFLNFLNWQVIHLDNLSTQFWREIRIEKTKLFQFFTLQEVTKKGGNKSKRIICQV